MNNVSYGTDRIFGYLVLAVAVRLLSGRSIIVVPSSSSSVTVAASVTLHQVAVIAF